MIEKKIPTVALRGLTIFPEMIIHFDLSREKSIKAIEQAMMEDQKVFLVTQKSTDEMEPNRDTVYDIGTIATVKQVTKLPKNIVRILVEGVSRGKLLEFTEEEQYLMAEVEEITEEKEKIEEVEYEAMLRYVRELFVKYSVYFPKVGKTIGKAVESQNNLGHLLDQIGISLPLNFPEKQEILAAVNVLDRYEVLTKILAEEIAIAKIRGELAANVKSKVEKNQKDYILREQMQYIKEELGEDNSVLSEIEQYRLNLKKIKATKEVKDRIDKELNRFSNMAPSSSESAVQRGYIETLLELPWDKTSKDSLDLKEAQTILDEDHCGLEQVKERVLEFLAVRTLTKKGQSPIICLVGPPGTGKTSIARSVARALHKKYVRISLGGVRDEAEIRGHRKTYVGAMPGRIVSGLKQAGVKNPVMLFDEIDKVSSDYKGDTSSALLEVLDAEQNVKFRDHYIELPIDLSEVLFIATANTTSTIPKPLLDRMELIEVTSYTTNEKFHIAKEHLVEKQIEKHGLKGRLSITDEAVKELIQFYTREAGVRELERKFGQISRKVAREILQTGKEEIQIGKEDITTYLGKRKYTLEKANLTDEIGIVRGLAWTSVGGDTLQIEVNQMPGKGEVELTGQMGDVMRESAKTGISYIRSVSETYHVKPETFKEFDFHIHIPEGAVPKDGPSAGITMATAILSVVTNTPIKGNLAMTGEITLRGRVLPIGGLKEKMLAAKTAGITTVLVPKKNKSDVEEISEEIKEGMTIHLVETMEEVVAHAFAK
ncbi:MAG: endopeptidase La [Eubacteriales bacterium]